VQFPPIPDWVDLRPGAMPRPIDRRFRLAWLRARGLLPDFAHDWADDLAMKTADVLRGAQPADATIIAALNLRAGPILDRGEIEARLISEQAPVDVAAAMGLSGAVVDAYAKLFFNLTGQTQARSWVLHEGIGSKAFHGLRPDDVDVILKLIGFRDGLVVLEPAIRHYRKGLHLVTDLDAVPGLDPEEKAWARTIRFWVAVRTLNDPVAILKLRAAFHESKPQQAASPGLYHRVTLEMAAEAVSRAADVAPAAERQTEPPVAASNQPVCKPVRRPASSGARRRTAPGGRRRVAADLVLVGV
jgi:hypothetical protein